MKHLIIKLYFALSILLLAACVKKGDKDIAPAPTFGTLNLHLHTMLDSLELETLDSAYSLASGKVIKVSTAQLYISNVRLVKADGSETIVDGSPILVTNEQERYDAGQVAAGNYVAVKFNVGLNPVMNTTEPVSTDSVLFNPQMWFGKSVKPDGYVFLKFEGQMASSTSSPLQAFSFNLGTNENLVTIQTMPKNIAIIPKNVSFVHLNVNYAKLFQGIAISKTDNINIITPLQNAQPIAKRIVQNVQMMFEYEE